METKRESEWLKRIVTIRIIKASSENKSLILIVDVRIKKPNHTQQTRMNMAPNCTFTEITPYITSIDCCLQKPK